MMASFCDRRTCSFDTSYTGKHRIKASVIILGIELPRKNWFLSKQCPPSMKGCHVFWTGTHWKMETKITAIHQANVMPPRTYPPNFINRIGKMR